MKPTGWFQVAWSDEIKTGDVRRMTYFNTEMIAWRAQSGQLTVMDAYCEHLGAHLGYGGHVDGEVIQCPFHGWQWNHEGRNVCIPYQDRPNRGRRIRTYPVVERNESVYIWHDIERRDPFFDAPDIFASFDQTQRRRRLLPAAAVLPRGAGNASAVRPRKRRRLRPFQVCAPDAHRAGVHSTRLRRPDLVRRLHHHVRR